MLRTAYTRLGEMDDVGSRAAAAEVEKIVKEYGVDNIQVERNARRWVEEGWKGLVRLETPLGNAAPR